MTTLTYDIPHPHDPSAVLSWMQSRLPVRLDRRVSGTRTYLETFDWRLYKAGYVMEALTVRPGFRVVLRTLDDEDVLFDVNLSDMPRFAASFPRGPLRERLEPVLDVRAVLPLASMRSEVLQVSVLNEELKTVLRLEIIRDRRSGAGKGRAGDPGTRVRLLPLRGYRKEAKHVAKLLSHELNAAPATRDVFRIVLDTAQTTPGDYSGKPEVKLRSDERTDVAARLILRALLRIMRANEAGVREDLDSEFLHDFRVSVRRTRSLLGQVKGIFPESRLERYRREFAWLGQVTTPVRDLDVYLLSFDGFQASLPHRLQPGLDAFGAFLERHKQAEQRQLVKSLGSARYRRLTEGWSTYLESPPPRRTTLANAMRPVGAVARERIWKVYRRVLKEGRAIHTDTPAAALHELRKTCKKLRYLMEFFRSLFPKEGIDELIKALKGFQDNLGEYQDLFVQHAALVHFREEMEQEGTLEPVTYEAMAHLVDTIDHRQLAVREEFATRFAAFSDKRIRRRFKELFAGHRVAVAS